MVIIISKTDQKAERIDKSQFENEKELEQFINAYPESILNEIKENANFLTINQFPTKVTGNIDVLAIDENEDIYIVETKLIRNSDRRDVIAQALDYAAALTYEYTDLEFISTLNDEIVRSKKYEGRTLNTVLESLLASSMVETHTDITSLVEQVRDNIKTGNLKIIVIMDKIEDRLKDVIYFINQKSKFTIYAIDMEYYKYHDGLKIMVQNSYGVEVKKALEPRSTSRFDEKIFFEIATARLTKEQLEGLHCIFQFCTTKGEIRWQTKSFTVSFPKLIDKSLFMIKPNGELQLFYGNLQPNDKAVFLTKLSCIGQIANINEGKSSPMCMDANWLLSANIFIIALKELLNTKS